MTDENWGSPAAPLNLSSWVIFRMWFLLGLQSFGGGVATLTLIRRAVIEQYGWLSEAEFTRAWSLCQMTPGINLLALTVLIGRKQGNWRGAALALMGLLLPSVTVTVLVTAGYARVRNLEIVRAALKGVVPATVGLGLMTAYQMARPLIISGPGSRQRWIIPAALLVCSGLAFALWHPHVLLVLGAAGVLGALVRSRLTLST